MQAPTLFVLGLVAGAVVVFGVRAATLEHEEPTSRREAAAPAVPAPQGDHAMPGAKLHVNIDGSGTMASVILETADGRRHVVAPGGRVAMGDYPAEIPGREGPFTAHLHPRSDDEIEVTVRDADGAVVAEQQLLREDSRGPENTICPVMGNEVDPSVFVDYQGRRIGFCCSGCDEVFLQDPEKYLAKVDAELASRGTARAADTAPAAALDPDRPPENRICPVMGNPVDPTIYVDYEGRRIGFCCPGCDKLFLEEPEKYLEKVDAELHEREGGGR